MLALISAPRFPSIAQNEPQDLMVSVARAIIHAIPLHRRAPSASPSVASTSTLEADERTHLLTSSLKTVRNYGSTLIKHSRSESSKAELKATISRPVAQEQDWWSEVEEQAASQQVERQEAGEESIASRYSTHSWAGQTMDELNRVGAFEFDEAVGRTKQQNRDSIQSFTSSERSYAFF
ncbi:hypothetical protein PSEUBRA_006141 [Kalmanozyma brasiliensis GHG001]|uniref:Uncharacterized protein n=1 Tax=Kalmanozyma brasiliensis (strain GHG001) TaxID=1365824 RepID=V5ESE9_KALBG|nr:uncharacterized protein PSEUBRA_006141 [Kalmanozyma brasiliensis GHG001]EST04834.1 hypothetical protein PSEUBRA_006141 [Kalmanozyma brasiliensis GHG001]